MNHRRSRLALLLLACAVALAACAGLGIGNRGGKPELAITTPGPSAPGGDRALELLNRRIATTESRLAEQGSQALASRLAALRMTRRARDLLESGARERALDLLERAIAVDGSQGFGYLYLARVHALLGNLEQSRIFLDRATTLLPADARLAAEIARLREDWWKREEQGRP